MGPIAQSIKEKLEKAFNPTQLNVIDDSAKHAGHAGARDHADKHGLNGESAESHFHVIIKSNAFEGLSILARHRAVMEVLAEEMDGRVHALSLDAKPC